MNRRVPIPAFVSPYPFKAHPLGPWGALREEVRLAERALRLLEGRVARRHGLSSSEATILIWAHRHHGSTGANVSRALHLSTSRVSQVVQRLERRRLVWRRARGDGGRVAGLYPTTRGMALAVQLGNDARQALERAAGTLDEKDVETLVELCGRIARSAELATALRMEGGKRGRAPSRR